MHTGRHEALKRYSLLLLIAILVGSAYYFLRIQQNEIQQNHGYLRQLKKLKTKVEMRATIAMKKSVSLKSVLVRMKTLNTL